MTQETHGARQQDQRKGQGEGAPERRDGGDGEVSRWGLTGRSLHVAEALALLALVWVLITAVSAIGDGFDAAVGGQAEELFSFATNPFVGLAIGILATVLTQSSSTTTSIVVGLVAGGLPISVAVPVLIGANVGTTMTNTIVSFGAARRDDDFRRSFSAASVHDAFNLLAIAVILPLELLFGILQRASDALSEALSGTEGGVLPAVFGGIGEVVSVITEPGNDLLTALTSPLGSVAQGIVLVAVGVVLILLSVTFIARLLKTVMTGRAERLFDRSVGRGPVAGLAAGALLTLMVQSSSTATSLAVPMAAADKMSLRQVYPYTIGANVGTTATAVIAAFAFTGAEATLALQAALVHLLYNVLALLLIFVNPLLREVPLRLASWLGEMAARSRVFVVVWVLSVFVLVPGALVLVSDAVGG
ncbi:hypothetical protein [Pseudokineococcus sp. 1T1Z-3]|uniref:hypothetical protein n=1 Tax=Pseudokineococcus sp. 1T1Z-3 TaxID=3132745 RepID=UPI0030B4C9C7